MNYIVVFAHVMLVFYILYVFFETYFNRYYVDVRMVTYHALAILLCCAALMILPQAYDSFLIALIVLFYPMLSYRREKGWWKAYLHWLILVLISYASLIALRYLISILPEYAYPIHYHIDALFCNILAFMLLVYMQKVRKLAISTYAVVVNVSLIVTFLLNLFYFHGITYSMDRYEQLFPIALITCFLLLFRCSYAMEKSKDNVLNLTVKRYAEKENKDKYEAIEKENQLIMQQMHDMKKHLQMLEHMQQHQEEYEDYKHEIVSKAEELLFLKQTGNPLIDRILQTYRPRLLNAHIQCNVEVDEIDFSFMNAIDMSAMLANLLDNAIESCLKCEERFLLLKIKKQRDIVIIKMKNSCQDVAFENGELHTTKADHVYHGFGMRNIAMIAHKYKGSLNYHFDEEHHVFTTSVSLFPDRS